MAWAEDDDIEPAEKTGTVVKSPALKDGLEPLWFDDEAIIEQSQCMLKTKDGKMAVGVALTIQVLKYVDGTEIVLEYEQLKTCLAYLEKDIDACQSMKLEGF
jgi:hypothetical protein